MKKLDAVFYGEVISIGEQRTITRENRTEQVKPIAFKLLRIWKGTKMQEMTIEANAHDSCRVELEVGQKHLIYAGKWVETDNLNYIDHCSFVKIDKEVLEKFYGAGEVIESKQPSREQPIESKGFVSTIWQTITSFFS